MFRLVWILEISVNNYLPRDVWFHDDLRHNARRRFSGVVNRSLGVSCLDLESCVEVVTTGVRLPAS